MKKITYTIENKVVWKNIEVDGVTFNFYGLYKGNTRKECEEWLKKYKEKLKANGTVS